MHDHREKRITAAIMALVHEVHELRLAWQKYFGQHTPKVRFDVRIGPITDKRKKEDSMTTIDLENWQEVIVTLAPRTDKGKPAKVDGIPTWTVQSGNATVTPAADGMSALLTTTDEADTTVILAEGDADLGAGFVPVDEAITLNTSVPRAASFGVTVGEPTQKPEAEPAPAFVGEKTAKAKKHKH